VGCKDFPCIDIDKESYIIPNIDIKPERIKMVMISEAAPKKASDYYYGDGDPLFEKTTVQAFKDAGAEVTSVRDLLDKGVYFTTAVKCGKTGYGIKAATIKECSTILEEELALFPKVKVLMLMGDVAIKALNYISRRTQGERAIPAGSTYKIRKGEFFYKDMSVYPSYLQAGPAFLIERSKRRMIAEDITNAMKKLTG
jgi:uracil-DNA glycosylase